MDAPARRRSCRSGASAFAVTLGLGLPHGRAPVAHASPGPLTEMSRAAGAIAAGQPRPPARPSTRRDELGDLAACAQPHGARPAAASAAAARAELIADLAREERRARALHLHRLPRPQEPARDDPGLRRAAPRPTSRGRPRAGAPGPRPHRGRGGQDAPPARGPARALARRPRGAALPRTCPSGELAREAVELVQAAGSTAAASPVEIAAGPRPVVRADRRAAARGARRTSWRTPPSSRAREPQPRIEIGCASRTAARRCSSCRDNGRGDRRRGSSSGCSTLFEKLDPAGRRDGRGARPRAPHRRGARRPRLGGVGGPRPRGHLLLHAAVASRRLTLRPQPNSCTAAPRPPRRLRPWRRRIVATPTGAG